MTETPTYLHEGAIDLHLLSSLQAGPNTGANAIFMGTIRQDEIDGKRVQYIDYSAYRAMAEKVFARIESSIREKYPLHEVVILHSVGKVSVGETGMLVIVSSQHRAEAFAALREVVEHIKAYAPVWKKEVYGDNSYDWVGCEHCATAHEHLEGGHQHHRH